MELKPGYLMLPKTSTAGLYVVYKRRNGSLGKLWISDPVGDNVYESSYDINEDDIFIADLKPIFLELRDIVIKDKRS